MALTLIHNFVSPITDLNEAGVVGPDDWNEAHSVSGVLGIANGGTGASTAEDALINLGAPTARNVRKVTAAGAVTVDADTDDIIVIKKTVGEATTVNLPAAADRDPSRPIKIVDGKGDADTNPITIDPNGSETVAVVLTSYVINFQGGSVDLWPNPDEDGWYI